MWAAAAFPQCNLRINRHVVPLFPGAVWPLGKDRRVPGIPQPVSISFGDRPWGYWTIKESGAETLQKLEVP